MLANNAQWIQQDNATSSLTYFGSDIHHFVFEVLWKGIRHLCRLDIPFWNRVAKCLIFHRTTLDKCLFIRGNIAGSSGTSNYALQSSSIGIHSTMILLNKTNILSRRPILIYLNFMTETNWNCGFSYQLTFDALLCWPNVGL